MRQQGEAVNLQNGLGCKMIKVALCDDNEQHLMEIQSVLTGILFDRIEFDICLYKNGIDVVEAIRTGRFSADLIILEIGMKPINGLGVAKLIRSNKIKCDIIFLTASNEYILEGYKYGAFDYIVKPVSITRLQKTMDRYVNEKEYNTEFFFFKTGSTYKKLDISKVEAFANSGRKISVIPENNDICFYGKLDDIEKNIIVDKLFIRPHQSFLVNMMHISSFGAGKVILSSGYEIPIVKKRYHESCEKFKSFAETKGYLF